MNRDKKIEEMAKVIKNKTTLSIIEAKGIAEFLTVEGYRKASEVAREIFEEIEKLLKKNELRNYEPYNVESYYSGELEKDLAELKKKCTESEDTE